MVVRGLACSEQKRLVCGQPLAEFCSDAKLMQVSWQEISSGDPLGDIESVRSEEREKRGRSDRL